MIFNVHTHINDDQEYDKVEELIQECLDNKIDKLVVIGYDVKSSIRAVELANRFDIVYAAINKIDFVTEII